MIYTSKIAGSTKTNNQRKLYFPSSGLLIPVFIYFLVISLNAQAETLTAGTHLAEISNAPALAKNKSQADMEEMELDAIVESRRRRVLADWSITFVRGYSREILNRAYPLAFRQLRFKDVELVGVGRELDGYQTTVRLHYSNLLKNPHFLDIAFLHDSRGGYRSWDFSNHSDLVAPQELTIGSIADLIDLNIPDISIDYQNILYFTLMEEVYYSESNNYKDKK